MAGPLVDKSRGGIATDGKRPEGFGTVVLFTYNNK